MPANYTSHRLGLPLLLGTLLVGTPAIAQQSLTRDLSIEQKYIADFAVPEGDLKLVTWLDRQDDTYRSGDVVQVFVKPSRDAYITIIDVGTSGKVQVLFPNKHHPDNHVLAHQVLQIPGPEAPYRIRVGGPAGHELLKIIATTRSDQVIRPEQLAESGPFQTYRGSAEGLTRDLSIELKEGRGGRQETATAVINKVFRVITEGVSLRLPARTVGPASSAISADELYQLGDASYFGQAGAPNYREALRLFALAAEAGHVGAMVRIGRIHESGLASEPDLVLAQRWYRTAADLGNTQAMMQLARLTAKDISLRDPSQIVRWLKKAAAQGDGIAMTDLAKMHDEGHGVDRAPREAARYFLSALKAGAWPVIDQITKLSDETRREVQVQLRQSGFYSGQIDGRIGIETRAALTQFAREG